MLVSWLERTGHGNITLLDNASTYPPLLDYLARSSHRVIRLEENLGHRVPWRCGIVGEFGEEMPFVVTDPDVLPDPQVPAESFEYMQELLLRHPAFDKIGFGLHIDDLPNLYPFREQVIAWERPFWEKEVEPGVFAAHLDTTLALHRPGCPYKVTEALRTAEPYMARHLPWYRDPLAPDEEVKYYQCHRDQSVGYWNRSELHPKVSEHLAFLACVVTEER